MMSMTASPASGPSVTPTGMAAPLLSVVMPVYRTPKARLLRALDSMRSLDVPFECVLVFDGEPDAALRAVADSFDADWLNMLTVEHGGPSKARNAGIAAAHGRWLCFLDADDELVAEGVEQLAAYGNEHACQIVQGASEKQMAKGIERCMLSSDAAEYQGYDGIAAFRRTIFQPDLGTSTVWSKLFDREFIVSNHIEFDTALRVAEDTAFVLDAVNAADNVGYDPTLCYRYYRNESSLVSGFRAGYAREMETMLRAFRERIADVNDPLMPVAYDEFVVFHLLLVMMHYVFNPDAPDGMRGSKRRFNQVLDNPLYDASLKRVDLSRFSKAKAASIQVLRMHSHMLMRLVCRVRHAQLS